MSDTARAVDARSITLISARQSVRVRDYWQLNLRDNTHLSHLPLSVEMHCSRWSASSYVASIHARSATIIAPSSSAMRILDMPSSWVVVCASNFGFQALPLLQPGSGSLPSSALCLQCCWCCSAGCLCCGSRDRHDSVVIHVLEMSASSTSRTGPK